MDSFRASRHGKLFASYIFWKRLGWNECGHTLCHFFTTSSMTNVKDTITEQFWVVAILLKVFATDLFGRSLFSFSAARAEEGRSSLHPRLQIGQGSCTSAQSAPCSGNLANAMGWNSKPLLNMVAWMSLLSVRVTFLCCMYTCVLPLSCLSSPLWGSSGRFLQKIRCLCRSIIKTIGTN